MSLESLYSQQIKAWAKLGNADNRLDDPDVSLEKRNPTCGSKVIVTAKFGEAPEPSVDALGLDARRACLLTQAATHALMMGDLKAIDQGFEGLQQVLSANQPDLPSAWSHLATFAPVAPFRARHSSILLPFLAVNEALGA